MEFQVNSKLFLGVLMSVGKIIPQKTAMPILTMFCMDVKDGYMVITASDGDIVVKTMISVESNGTGVFCIDAKRLIDFFKAMPDCKAEVCLDSETMKAVIKYTNGKYNINARSADDYPFIDIESSAGEPECCITMDAKTIKTALENVAFAVDNNGIRPVLTGILWHIERDSVTFVSSNTQILAKYRNTGITADNEADFILPVKTAGIISGMAGKDAKVIVRKCNEQIYFHIGKETVIRSTLLKGSFPDYNRVIPKDNTKRMIVERPAWIDAISRVSQCVDSKNQMMRIEIGANEMLLTSQDLAFEVGGSETVQCQYSDEPVVFGFSSENINKILLHIPTERAVMTLDKPTRPILFYPVENDEFGELLYLGMPMCIKE